MCAFVPVMSILGCLACFFSFFRFPFVELFDDFDVGSRDYLLARQTLKSLKMYSPTCGGYVRPLCCCQVLVMSTKCSSRPV